MSNINSRLGKIEKQLSINDPPIVFRFTDENGIKHKIKMSREEWENLIKSIPPTKGTLPCQEEKEVKERLKNDKIRQKPTE